MFLLKKANNETESEELDIRNIRRNKKRKIGSARSQVGIKEVRDNILILNNYQYRMILSTSSVNFELQSEAEQDVLIDNFQAFLNSLSIPIQILIRIRELDIEHYLDEFKTKKTGEDQEIYKKQLDNYAGFIRKLVSGNRILSRRFYLVIAYDNPTNDFDIVKEQLMLEQEIIVKGLEKLNLSAKPLNNLEILNLFYAFYRPNQAKIQPLVELITRRTNEI